MPFSCTDHAAPGDVRATSGPRRAGAASPWSLRATVITAVALSAWGGTGCARSPGDRLIDRSISHLEAAVEMMEAAAGDERVLLDRSMQYRALHAVEIARLRQEGEALLASLPADESAALLATGRKRSKPLDHQLQELARRFPDPSRALRLVRPLIVQATPQPKHFDEPPWMPKVPVDLLGPPPGPGGNGHAGHDHGALPPPFPASATAGDVP